MTEETLNKILERHAHYLAQDVEDWESYRAIFDGLDLSGMDLSFKNLQYASFQNVDFSNANLDISVFRYCNFFGAKFFNTKLDSVHFDDCDFSFASFTMSNLVSSWSEHCSFKHMRFETCKMDRALFSHCKFNRVLFSNSLMNFSNWYDSIFYEPCTFYNSAILDISMDYIKGIKNIEIKRCTVRDIENPVSNRSILYNICRQEYIHYIFCRIKAFFFGQSSLKYWE